MNGSLVPCVLVPCANCARHRRAHERACPFCEGTSIALPGPASGAASGAAARVALLAALAAVAACRDPRGADIYGAPPVRADAAVAPFAGSASVSASASAVPVAASAHGPKPSQFNPLDLGSKPPWETPRPMPRYGSPPDPQRRDALREAPALAAARERFGSVEDLDA